MTDQPAAAHITLCFIIFFSLSLAAGSLARRKHTVAPTTGWLADVEGAHIVYENSIMTVCHYNTGLRSRRAHVGNGNDYRARVGGGRQQRG